MTALADRLARLAANRENLVLRSRILQIARRFFLSADFLEVTTPVLSRDLIPEEHIDPVETDSGYLLPSPEIHMKGLLAAGYERIFQIGPVFRKGESGRHHLPEFTLLEWYRTGEDYTAVAADAEGLLLAISAELFHSRRRSPAGGGLDLTPPWPRVTVREAFVRLAGWDPLEERAPERFEEDFALKVIPGLDPARPTFLVEFPTYEASLARRKEGDPRVAERFELFAGGLELANGFSELTDPAEQRLRFAAANRAREGRGKRSYGMPEDFLAVVDRLGPCAGVALGMDRLVMLVTGAGHIGDVVCSPAGG
jgi:elongation factor P--(R)-beta-lysine ligase